MRGNLYIADNNTPIPLYEDIVGGKIPITKRVASIVEAKRLFDGE